MTYNLTVQERQETVIRVTTLSENTAARTNLLAEWGLSFLIEADGLTILLDAGQSISSCHNADALGIDLTRIDRIVLSHGHYDHTGGLSQVLRKIRKPVAVIAHPEVWAAKYRGRQEPYRYIGIPFQRQELESLGAKFTLTAKPVKISENVMTTGEIPMVTDFETIDANLFVKSEAGWQPDDLPDDQALVIKAEPGLIVLPGCAHRGVINTLYYAQQLTGIKAIYAVLGGVHLISASDERIHRTISALKELEVKKLGLSHCTGLRAMMFMAQEFGESFFFNNAGTVTSFP